MFECFKHIRTIKSTDWFPDEDGPEKQAESKDKNINSESGEEMSSSKQESPRFLHKEIRQKCTEYFRSGLSELDVLKKNITGLARSTIYRHFQKLRLQGTSQRKFGSGRVKNSQKIMVK